MDIKDLNKISIREYLANKGINPIKDRGYYGMYHSPFREDCNASLKVDFSKNLWIDFGSNDGGTMIDLVMRINNCSLSEAMNDLHQYNNTTEQQKTNESFSFHGNKKDKEPTIQIVEIKDLTNIALLNYLKERDINIEIAKLHCKEIHYTINDKPYFAIGFKNDSGGYELRNKYFKGCTSKDCTTNNHGNEPCLVFEGFIDYLSFLTIKDTQSATQNIVVLNSVANLSKAINFIQSHKEIYTYLDNDEVGKKATEQIKTSCSNSIVSDQSVHYMKYKDLNEYLVSTKQKLQEEQQPLQRKPSRGFKM